VREVEITVHPDKKETRMLPVENIFIDEIDFKKNKGKEIRLLHLFNVRIDKTGKVEFTSEQNKDIPKLNWVSNPVNCKILMDNGKWISGIADPGIAELKVGDIIQFERFGFCRFDAKNKHNYEFWFTHR